MRALHLGGLHSHVRCLPGLTRLLDKAEHWHKSADKTRITRGGTWWVPLGGDEAENAAARVAVKQHLRMLVGWF